MIAALGVAERHAAAAFNMVSAVGLMLPVVRQRSVALPNHPLHLVGREAQGWQALHHDRYRWEFRPWSDQCVDALIAVAERLF